jgi:Leucine Rich repeat
MEAEPPKVAPPNRKRRWFQFSLRSLLIVVVSVAIPCVWLGRTAWRKRKETRAIDSIDRSGGTVLFDYEIEADRSRSEGARPPGPAWLRSLLGETFFAKVVQLGIGDRSAGTNVEQLIEQIKEMRHVEVLDLSGAKLTDPDLVNLGQMSKLRVLRLDMTGITDAGLIAMKGLSKLEALYLADTAVNDAGLVNLQSFNRLTALNLNGTKVTDTGLASLKGLARLQMLFVSNTGVTSAGIADLQAALPHCAIYSQ